MLKVLVKRFLQGFLGFENYLFIFSIYTIRRLRVNRHEKEFSHFLKMVPNEGVILDIGANVGAMTVSLAQKLNKAEVYAFEPMPQNIKVLNRVVKYYKLTNVKSFGIALGNEAGELKMVLPVIDKMKMQGLSHVVKENDNSDWNKGDVFTVPVKKLDDLDELKNIPKISAIKIDVENFEYNVFRGGRELLLRHMPLIYCELWTNEQQAICLNYLRELGYEVNVFDGTKFVPFTDQVETNFFLTPRTAATQLN